MRDQLAPVAATIEAPVAIGGVGGSGTRLIAQLLRELGCFMGGDLNEACDNLWFTLLFKRIGWLGADSGADFAAALRIFTTVMAGGGPLSGAQALQVRRLAAEDRLQHPAAWLGERADSLLAATPRPARAGRWGWKEPNTHVFLDRLQAHLPTMRYIHVMRNGLDMAFSGNQNQLMLWGSHFLGTAVTAPSPRMSLAYWCRVHRRVAHLAERMPGRYLLINYDAFCARPQAGLAALLEFLGWDADAALQARLLGMVRAPQSIGRLAAHDAGAFDPADLAYVRAMGFETAAAGSAS